MAVGGDLENRLFLGGVQRDPPVRGPRDERVEDGFLDEIGGDVVEVGEEIGEMHVVEPIGMW